MVKIPVDGKITFFFQIVQFFFKHGGENSFKKDFQFFFSDKTWSLSKFKSFRKGSSATSSAGESESNDMFGVPLECCIPSPNNDVSISSDRY